MTFPNFKNKHLEEALFSPEDKSLSINKIKVKLPKKWILTYNYKNISKWIKKKYGAKEFKINRSMDVYLTKDIGFVKQNGFGSPYSVYMMEELIQLGGKVFLNLGTAGGLYKEGIFLCTKALRDEGTSYHYSSSKDKFSYPDEDLTNSLGKALAKEGIIFQKGATWTIDAPLRETKKEVDHYSKKGICTVEMESSALFTLARYRGVKIASAFVVSDILGKKWQNKYGKSTVETLKEVIDAGVKCLT